VDRIHKNLSADEIWQGDKMKFRLLIVLLMIGVPSMFAGIGVRAAVQNDLADLRYKTAQFYRPEMAQEAGYILIPALDYCFNNTGIGAMNSHYINTSLFDTTVDLLQPEVMVYTPDFSGKLQLSAVEYVVPAAEWDATHSELPQVLGHDFHLNRSLGLYTIYIWIWKNNPSGMFEDRNPKISCG